MASFRTLAVLALFLMLSSMARAVERELSAPCANAALRVTDVALLLGSCPGARGVEPVIYGSSIAFMPPVTEVDAVLDVSRRHTSAEGSSYNVTWHEPTTLNAIALSQASGVPLGVDDVADRTGSAARALTWANFLIPHADVIENILALGVEPVEATAFDVSYAGTFLGTAEASATRRITDDNTMSGLALLGGGVALDPHILIDSTDRIGDRSRVGTFPGPSIPPGGADLAGQAAIAGIHGQSVPGVFAFSNRSVEEGDLVQRSRVVELPDEIALAGLALQAQGIEFDPKDAVSYVETTEATEDDQYEYHRERAVLRYWLTLGLRFDS